MSLRKQGEMHRGQNFDSPHMVSLDKSESVKREELVNADQGINTFQTTSPDDTDIPLTAK